MTYVRTYGQDTMCIASGGLTHSSLYRAPPRQWTSKVAYGIAQTLRFSFDLLAGFKTHKATEAMYLNRVVFLETVAGIPGMVGGMLRHLNSLRRMKRDHGWIHTLLEEAENERMHLLTFLQLKKPGPLFRLAVVGVQGAFFTTFFLAYFVNPKICHRLVGYIEEEAVKTVGAISRRAVLAE